MWHHSKRDILQKGYSTFGKETRAIRALFATPPPPELKLTLHQSGGGGNGYLCHSLGFFSLMPAVLATSYIGWLRKKKTHLDLRKKKHTAVFEVVQLLGITSAMYTWIVFLDPCLKGLLFVMFLVDLVCVDRTAGPNIKFSLFSVFKKWKLQTALSFGRYEPCVSEWPYGCHELSFWIVGHMGHLAAIFTSESIANLKVRHSSENDRWVSLGPKYSGRPWNAKSCMLAASELARYHISMRKPSSKTTAFELARSVMSVMTHGLLHYYKCTSLAHFSVATGSSKRSYRHVKGMHAYCWLPLFRDESFGRFCFQDKGAGVAFVLQMFSSCLRSHLRQSQNWTLLRTSR